MRRASSLRYVRGRILRPRCISRETNYFGLSSRNVTLGYQAGRVDTMDVQTTVPYAIQWLDTSGTPVGSAVSGVGASLPDNGGFTVAIAPNSDDAEIRHAADLYHDRGQSYAERGDGRIEDNGRSLDFGCFGKAGESGKIPQAFHSGVICHGGRSFGTNNPLRRADSRCVGYWTMRRTFRLPVR